MSDAATARYAALAAILSDLDRCEHGRHAGERCFGCSSGWSAGNPHLPGPGERVGYDYAGRPYVVPQVYQSSGDPASWRPAPEGS